jgi:2-oxoacid:acceptor oxidoreductase delta subunit (pyruvate/2-ketoisovalerate family)
VLIIGGGNTAMDCARTALRLGAQPIVVYRRTREEMPAIAEEIEEAEHEGTQFEFLAAPTAIYQHDGTLEVHCIRMQLGEPDASGRRRPIPIPGSDFVMRADSVLKAVGEEPELSFLSERLETSEGIVMERAQGLLERAGIFVGGDAQTGPKHRRPSDALRQRDSIGYYAIPARRAQAQSLSAWRSPARELQLFCSQAQSRNTSAPGRRENLELCRDEARPSLADQARVEAQRCFSCGVCNNCDNCWVFCPDAAITRIDSTYEVNYDFCKGCGICAEECPRSVISLVEEEL